jgi:predicted nucleic acid-binding protein
MILVDTSGLIALLDRGEREHSRVLQAIETERGPLVVTDWVLAEADYLILRRLGRSAEKAFIDQLIAGVFLREPIGDSDLRRANDIASAISDQEIGLTDATLMALTERMGTRKVLTLDHRHFGIYRDPKGRALEMLPA